MNTVKTFQHGRVAIAIASASLTLFSLACTVKAQDGGGRAGATGQSAGTLRYGGGLIVTTIEANSQWPGPRPTGMLQRLGYGNSNPSDDQILLDVILHVDTGPLYLALNFYEAEEGRDGIVVPAQGSLANASNADRKWLTLAMLSRSTNQTRGWSPIPLQSMRDWSNAVNNQDDYTDYIPVFFGDFRLVNNLRVKARVGNGKFVKDADKLERLAIIGPTPMRFNTSSPLYVTCEKKDPEGKRMVDDVSLPLSFAGFLSVPNIQDSAPWGNDLIKGGSEGGKKIIHRTASRIGPILMDYEDYMLNNIQPPPFYSEVVLSIQGDKLHLEHLVSNQHSNVINWFESKETGVTWPTHHIYLYDHRKKQYVKTAVRAQTTSPFEGFIPGNW